MRPDVGEEMSRQPSLPSLSIEGNLVRTSRNRELNNPNCTHDDPRSARAVRHARPKAQSRSPVTTPPQQSSAPDPLTRPRSFRDAALRSCADVSE
jgi:hypothetical protein